MLPISKKILFMGKYEGGVAYIYILISTSGVVCTVIGSKQMLKISNDQHAWSCGFL